MREDGSSIFAEDDPLAENVQRVALYPLEQFRAFRDILEKGLVRGGNRGRVLRSRHRLRLMTVSEKLLDIYE
ncbi:putative plasmid stabilization protein [Acetobacter tropicalis]|uniref:Putative plasmid stabilization protein n=1 Tax=Acetobacter tropicalis TaxID=104102 RepID=A0A094ZL44_9PROT|nr:putative plasmid stabilization protein [Acetobacter tropicalis]